MKPRVFVTHPLPGTAVDRLRESAEVVVGASGRGISDPSFADFANTFDGLVTLLTDRVDKGLLARCPKLKVVANVAVGVDNVDLAACGARDVTVTNTPNVLTEATADLAFGLMLAAARRIAEGDRMLRAGAWKGWSPTLLLGTAVHGATLGIIGMGRIGRAMARRARGFGMQVVYAERERLAPEMERALGARYAPVDHVFVMSDIVSLHCPLTPETRHIVSTDRLALMRLGSVLVNTSRGGCVDEAALVAALKRGPLAAAGLDVYEDEPHVNAELLALPNVVLAPHIASAEVNTREAMASVAIDNVIAVLEGRIAPHAV
jgi:glyoxylate reductase